MKWQTIDNAPKNGEPVDLWVDWGSGRCSRLADVQWIGDMANWAYRNRGGPITRLEGEALMWTSAIRPPENPDQKKSNVFGWSY